MSNWCQTIPNTKASRIVLTFQIGLNVFKVITQFLTSKDYLLCHGILFDNLFDGMTYLSRIFVVMTCFDVMT